MKFDLFTSLVSVAILLLYGGLLFWRIGKRGRTIPLRFSNTQQITLTTVTWKAKYRWILVALRILTLLALLIAFSRPQKGVEVVKTARQGIAIQMVIDRSSSMQKEMSYKGRMYSRLEVVKKVFAKFVAGDGDKLKGRNNDLIGLISFAGFTEENAPLTLDHQSLINFTNTISPAARIEDGTMIGDALYYSTLRLIGIDNILNEGREDKSLYQIKSRVILLLTDGQQTQGGKSPLEAAEFAKKNGIKIYTIAITDNSAYQQQQSLFGSFFTFAERPLDTSLLEEVAAITKGKFSQASSGEALVDIYHNIDTLEKSSFEERFTTYKEQYQVFVMLGLLFLGLEFFLAHTLLRKIP
jgi:Ca-activated chloride channel family protein